MTSLLADEIKKVYITEVLSFEEKPFPQFSPFLSNTANERLLPFQCYGGIMLASDYHPSQRERDKELFHITKAVAGLYSVGGK
jgi:hypothetical protein